MAFSGFGRPFFSFFEELAANNEKAWFEANRARFDTDVKATLQAFVGAIAPRLKAISPNFIADPKKSPFRIHRDVRFSKDKSPYKTNAGLQFRHAAGKDAHAPGFYLHLQPGSVFYGGGLWKPDSRALGDIRTAIAEKSAAWRKATAEPKFAKTFGGLSEGDPLSRPPRGFDAEHPLIEDIKKRSFFAMKEGREADAGKAGFVDEVADTFAAAAAMMAFLTEAVGVKF